LSYTFVIPTGAVTRSVTGVVEGSALSIVQYRRKAPLSQLPQIFVILNVTEGGVRDLLYLSFNIGAKRRSTKSNAANFRFTTLEKHPHLAPISTRALS
jgi:hypothetical protein